MEKYEFWLAKVKGISNQKKHFLMEKIKCAKNIFYIEETRLKELIFLNEKEKKILIEAQKDSSWKGEWKEMNEAQIQFVSYYHSQFPKRLKEIPNPPFALFVKGKLPEENTPSIAIVGARNCTVYGEKYALEYGGELSKYGINIISGLARGIDGMSQRGALASGGKTFAVVGCGVDICYPREHHGLYVDILKNQGGIISEYPPKTQPVSYYFPQRNRLISGLSDAVLVIEAREKSGSLITADLALEQGKDVYALPGPVHSSLSSGCNQLIRQGAGLLLSPKILLEELGFFEHTDYKKTDKNKIKLENTENMLYSCLDLFPKNTAQLFSEIKLPVDQLLECLVSLEMKGYIREVSKNYYVRLN